MSRGSTGFPRFRARRVFGGSSWVRRLIIGLWAFGLSAIGAAAVPPGDGAARLGSVVWEETLPWKTARTSPPCPPKQSPRPPAAVTELLNPDGTLDSDINYVGNVESLGYPMVEGAFWKPGFQIPGMDSAIVPAVMALAINTITGDLYAGGYFTTAGGVTVNHIAHWDGSAWSALGSGMDGFGINTRISTLAFNFATGDLYAGGNFTTAGGVESNYVAGWNGHRWSSLGTGMDDRVYELSINVASGDLYAVGDFTTAGSHSSPRFALWDGSDWVFITNLSVGSRDLSPIA